MIQWYHRSIIYNNERLKTVVFYQKDYNSFNVIKLQYIPIIKCYTKIKTEVVIHNVVYNTMER